VGPHHVTLAVCCWVQEPRTWSSMKAFDAYQTAPPTREFRAATVMPARGNLYDQRLYKIVD
jgi:hypothetical protein